MLLLHAGTAARGSATGTGALLPPDLPGLFTTARGLLLGARLLTLLTWSCALLARGLALLARGLTLLPWRGALLTRCLTLLTGSLALLPRSLPLLSGRPVLPWCGGLLSRGRTGLTDPGVGAASLARQAGAGLVRVFTRLLLLANTLPNRGALINFAATRLTGARLLRSAHARLALARTGSTISSGTGTRRRAATSARPRTVQSDQRHWKRESKRRAGCFQSCPHNHS